MESIFRIHHCLSLGSLGKKKTLLHNLCANALIESVIPGQQMREIGNDAEKKCQ